METTLAFPNSMNPSAVPVRGRAIATLICGFFGAVWLYEGLAFGGHATPFWLTVTGMFAAFFILMPTAQLLALRGVDLPADRARWKAASRSYWTVVIIEWVACAVAANWLNYIGHSELTLHAIGAIVGLHFLPLARIFRARIYNWTGVAMMLGVLVSFVMPEWHGRILVTCAASGLALWATAAVILCQDRR